jgi:hypothetical protein
MKDAADVGFKVVNFDRVNMTRLERNWERIEQAIRLGVRLLDLYEVGALRKWRSSLLS